MNKKVLVIAVALMTLAMLATPVLATTKTITKVEVWQRGTHEALEDADFYWISSNGRIEMALGLRGTGRVWLYMEGGPAIVFDSSNVGTWIAIDSTDHGISNGILIRYLNMRWTSIAGDGGFKGVLQWTAIGGVHKLYAVYRGFGDYEGQTLRLSGTWIPGEGPGTGQHYTGTLLS